MAEQIGTARVETRSWRRGVLVAFKNDREDTRESLNFIRILFNRSMSLLHFLHGSNL